MFSIRPNLPSFWGGSKCDVKTTRNSVKLKYIVKMANFDNAILKSEQVVRKTDYGASSGMIPTSRNQCPFGGTFPYISVIDTF